MRQWTELKIRTMKAEVKKWEAKSFEGKTTRMKREEASKICQQEKQKILH